MARLEQKSGGLEILADTRQPETAEGVSTVVQEKVEERREERANKLLKYEEQAKRDQALQQQLLVILLSVQKSIEKLERQERKAEKMMRHALLLMLMQAGPEAVAHTKSFLANLDVDEAIPDVDSQMVNKLPSLLLRTCVTIDLTRLKVQ